MYENDVLQFISMEQGRIRWEKANPNNVPATADRFGAAAGGVALATLGVNTTINSANNLINQNGRVNASSSNTSSGSGTRSKNKLPDQGGPSNGTLRNKPGTTVKKYNKDGNVVKEWNKGHPDHSKKSKNYKDHVHDYTKPGDKSSRRGARTPKRNEKLRDFQ